MPEAQQICFLFDRRSALEESEKNAGLEKEGRLRRFDVVLCEES